MSGSQGYTSSHYRKEKIRQVKSSTGPRQWIFIAYSRFTQFASFLFLICSLLTEIRLMLSHTHGHFSTSFLSFSSILWVCVCVYVCVCVCVPFLCRASEWLIKDPHASFTDTRVRVLCSRQFRRLSFFSGVAAGSNWFTVFQFVLSDTYIRVWMWVFVHNSFPSSLYIYSSSFLCWIRENLHIAFS